MKSLKSKLAVLGIIPILIIFLLVIYILLPSIKKDLIEVKKRQTHELVNVGISILEYYYLLEKDNKLTREEAQEQAKVSIRNLRNDYQFCSGKPCPSN